MNTCGAAPPKKYIYINSETSFCGSGSEAGLADDAGGRVIGGKFFPVCGGDVRLALSVRCCQFVAVSSLLSVRLIVFSAIR